MSEAMMDRRTPMAKTPDANDSRDRNGSVVLRLT